MSNDLKQQYIRLQWLRYQNASRRQKKVILDELCALTGCHRKHLIRRMKDLPSGLRKRPGRKRVYSEHAVYHLRKLWLLLNQMNSKRLKEALPECMGHYVASESVKQELCRMSAATIDRYLAAIRAKVARRGRSGTRPGRLLKHMIPIKPFDYNVHQPGHVEADLVAHCGGSLSGEFIWSLTFTDIYSGWTENRAVWGKGAHGVLESIRSVEATLPFPILSFNCDNGKEFLNHHLIHYFSPEGEKKRAAQLMTRSREYRKNDNCYVEQKNWTHVRELFGYDRFSNPRQVDLMNRMYQEEHRLLHNFFYPQMKLKTKLRIGSRYRRTYDKPKTPYRRILDCEQVPQHVKDSLTAFYKTLNPFRLRKEQHKKLKAFYQASKPLTDEKDAA